MGTVVYVLGPEGCGKSDLLHALSRLAQGMVEVVPIKVPPTTGQNIIKVPMSAGSEGPREVEVRELGGSMLPAWESFLKSHVARGKRAEKPSDTMSLLFVVDATVPHQFTSARYALQWLKTSPDAVCHTWPTALAVQKAGAPGAIPSTEIAAVLGVMGRDASNGIALFEVDSWNGLGIGDVFNWVKAQGSA